MEDKSIRRNILVTRRQKDYARMFIPEDAENVKLHVWTASADVDVLLDTVGSNLFIGKTILSRYVKPRKRDGCA